MRKLITVILSLIFLAVIVGCNTVEGLGKDIKKVGDKLEDAADR